MTLARFVYAFDTLSNRTLVTSTTPLSGTVVTTYIYDAANRLTDRAVSDGRSYTYDWSDRGQMLTEWTAGYPVRTFSYDSAGRMTQATVFTLTTRFTYDGDGARRIVEVVGHGTTTYTLDYGRGHRILAETMPTSTVTYLYGHDCMGQFDEAGDEWLYYLNDAIGYVRQGADEQGQVTSNWRFDPDGTVLEGPQGPVSHLICGGVYDWSTGLIFKGGRYFDPTLGIWLALGPLMVIQSWRGRKKKRRRRVWYALVLMVVCIGGLLTACDSEYKIVDQHLGGNVVFMDPCDEGVDKVWLVTEITSAKGLLDDVLIDKFGGEKGFGSLPNALAELGVSPSNPIKMIRKTGRSIDVPAQAIKPTIWVYDGFFHNDIYNVDPYNHLQAAILGHEMAHYWDHDYSLSSGHNSPDRPGMQSWINWGKPPTWRGRTGGDAEDFVESVMLYFWDEYDGEPGDVTHNELWTDDQGKGRDLAIAKYGATGPDGLWIDPTKPSLPPENQLVTKDTPGAVRVKDRYDYLQYLFGHIW